MLTEHAESANRAFASEGNPPILVKYQSQQDAIRFLRVVFEDSRGTGLIYGPKLSGKSTIVREFLATLPDAIAVAVVDGSRLKPQDLFSGILAQFGYNVELLSADELLKMLNVFVVQQTRADQAPLVVVENIENMYPSALRALCALARVSLHSRYAVRIVLTGSPRSRHLVHAEGLIDIAKRMVGSFEIKPLSAREAMSYLHARLAACGVRHPDQIFPVDVCDRLHGQSGGWPGLLNEHARSAMEDVVSVPVDATDSTEKAEGIKPGNLASAERNDKPKRSLPKLIVTCNGTIVCETEVKEKKLLIGRSGLADLVIDNQYVSKFHAMLMLYSDALVLVDLKSANGTFVNSRKVSYTALQDNDIISVGNHRIKVSNVPMAARSKIGQTGESDTAKVKTVADMRRQRLQRFLKIAGVDKKNI